MTRRVCLTLYICVACALGAWAQRADYAKMSAYVRQLVLEDRVQGARGKEVACSPSPSLLDGSRPLCAFVRVGADGERALLDHGCRVLARKGDICIASIPVGQLAALSLDGCIGRIEARRGMHVLMDEVPSQVNALPAYAGTALPQAYTGKGVVVGVQDIGFDLTHPNFYDATGQTYRIKAFWDQLAAHDEVSDLYVGAAYAGEADLLRVAHSRDGLKFSHGTHTLGTAAGCGAGTPWRGIAYESDICLVSNAVSVDIEFIDEADLDKYTYATDALGFKYIMDYAERMGQPCVISFSEGSGQDFRGDDVLFYDMLAELTGPGRIIVASAGNDGTKKTYFRKERGVQSAGTFLRKFATTMSFALRAQGAFDMRTVVYGAERNDTVTLAMATVADLPDGVRADTLQLAGDTYVFHVQSFPSCYDGQDQVYEVYVQGPAHIGMEVPLSVELIGREADVSFYAGQVELYVSGYNPSLDAGEYTHAVNSPASAPTVIAVGATAYRQQFVNEQGTTITNDRGSDGLLADYSSGGPTFDERLKPDVVAPGTNVVSSWNSYYLETPLAASTAAYDVASTEWNGRRYGWHCSTGTSMSAPAVAGVIALWLQANPSLTPDDILGILSRTCRHPDPSLSYPNNLYGHGEIDAYRGLLDILGLSAVEGISDHQPPAVRFSLQGRRLQLQFAEAPSAAFAVTVYSASGAMVGSYRFAATDPCTVDLSACPGGVYAVQVRSAQPALTGSTLVRLP